MAPIAVGDVIPDGNVSYFDEQDQMQTVSVHSLAKGKKVIIFAVPGAFTPTCSMKHVPGFIEKAAELKSKGVDEILCISVNDPFVMKAWAKNYPENKHVKFLADGAGKYTHALGLELDLSDKGLGVRNFPMAAIPSSNAELPRVEELAVVRRTSARATLQTTSSADLPTSGSCPTPTPNYQSVILTPNQLPIQTSRYAARPGAGCEQRRPAPHLLHFRPLPTMNSLNSSLL